MKNGFIKVAAALPDVRVGDVEYNLAECIKEAKSLADSGAFVVAFPELAITSASCGDMFFNRAVLCAAEGAIAEFIKSTEGVDTLFVIGAPVKIEDGVYNAAIAVKGGRMLHVFPLSRFGYRGDLMPKIKNFSYAGDSAPVSSLAKLKVGEKPSALTFTVVPGWFTFTLASLA